MYIIEERRKINKIVELSEKIENGNINKEKVLEALHLIEKITDRNLNVYKGCLVAYYFYTFKELPAFGIDNRIAKDNRFIKCLALREKVVIPAPEIGSLFLGIISIPDEDTELRDILQGVFYGCLWSFMNNTANFDLAVAYGMEIVKAAFSLDKFDYLNKIKLSAKNAKIVCVAGSGKKKIKLLNISSMSAIITAAVGEQLGKNIIVEKTVSGATSSAVGSRDIFKAVGVELNIPPHEMADLSIKTKLGIFDINNVVPRQGQIYDGRLYNVQVFAGLSAGSAIVCPIESHLISYGLTRGSNKLCLAILNKLYPNKNIIILTGQDVRGNSIIDQASVDANTKIAQIIKGESSFRSLAPTDFGFRCGNIKDIQSSDNAENNVHEFVGLLSGKASNSLKQVVAMEVALNLHGLNIINDLKKGAGLALKAINSGQGIKVLEKTVVLSGGDIGRFNKLVKNH